MADVVAQPAATQEERTEAARRALITAAIDILAEEGYRRLTFTRIQEVAGLSRGLVAYHFGSKVALVEHVIATIREEFHDQAQHDPSRSGYDELRGMVATYLDRFRADPRHAKVMLVLGTDSIGEQGPVTAAVRDTYQTYRDDLASFIERGMADGSIRAGIDPGAHAIVIEGFLRGIVLQYLVDPTQVDLDAVAVAAFETVDALTV